MLYQLPNGKVIEITTEQYLEMSDEDFEYLIAYNHGDQLENPWFGSVLSKGPSFSSNNVDDTESLKDLTNASEIDKLNELDAEDLETD